MDKITELYKKIIDNASPKIHVIDVDTFEILYANPHSVDSAFDRTRNWTDKKCYEFFFGKSEQCKTCPLRKADIEPYFVIEKRIENKVERVRTANIEWDGRAAYIEYVEDITKTKEIQLETERRLELIGALSSDYLNVFQINADTGESRIVKLDGYVTDGFDKNSDKIYDYKTMCLKYIDERVYSEDMTMMKQVMDLDNVKKELTDKSVYVGNYRVLDDGVIYYYQYKYLKIQGTSSIVAGFINVDRGVRQEIEQAAELKQANEELIQANKIRDRQLEILRSLSDIYYSMHYIDLKHNTTIEYSSSEVLKPFVNSTENASDQLYLAMKNRTDEKYLTSIMEFVDLNTVAARLKDKKIISMDFLNVDNVWLRASFIPVDKNADGLAKSVIYTTQIIDEYKRREQELILNSYTDELTRFYNRRAYEEKAKEFEEKGIPNNMVLVSFDLNGLKIANDSQGHAVGDELLLGAASCMKSCFGAYGTLYRIGGDEFMAIISANSEKLKEIIADFEETVSLWHNDHIDTLSISVGAVARKEFATASFDELEEIADNRMYKSKAYYYKHQSSKR